MLLATTRFGDLQCQVRDLVLFPAGLIGFEQLHAWLLLDELPLTWLQSAEDPQIALPLVSPFLFLPDYRLQLLPEDLEALHLEAHEQTLVLTVVARQNTQWTTNLRAPLLIRPQARLGRQVVTADEQSIRYALPALSGNLRKSA